MTIRRLTLDDWDAIEAVLDTRKKLQNTAMDDRIHSQMKEGYVKNRIGRDAVFFFGYFLEDELVAISGYNRTCAPGEIAIGVSWTKAGIKLQKWTGFTHVPACLVELRNYAVEYFTENYMLAMWSIGPTVSHWERLLDACVLSDPTRFQKEIVCQVPAFTRSGDRLIDDFVFVGATLGEDQTVFRYLNLQPKHLRALPPDAPPRQDKPTEHRAPERGLVPTQGEPPPK